MDGRWEVQFCGDCSEQYDEKSHIDCNPRRTDHCVPVVPCDDAAIERAVDALRDRYGREWKPERQARGDVLAVLRGAAGDAA